MADHSVDSECDPGGGTICLGCSAADVSIASFADYGEVTSNVNRENIWVNAIGNKKFIENLPNPQMVEQLGLPLISELWIQPELSVSILLSSLYLHRLNYYHDNINNHDYYKHNNNINYYYNITPIIMWN